MAEEPADVSIPVTLKDGNTWRSPRPILALCQMLYGLARSEFRTIHAAVMEKHLLDHASRVKAGNPISIDRTVGQLAALRRGNKGLAMEMTMSALLTHIDHPSEVLMNCTLDEETGFPHRPAGPYLTDIVVTPTVPRDRTRFRVVCEVSANKAMNPTEYRKQLVGGLNHAKSIRDAERPDAEGLGAEVTYVLVSNLQRIGDSDVYQGIYKTFVEDEENDLELMGSIRFVLIRASDLATAIKILFNPFVEPLEFEGHHLAEVFDVLHEDMMRENIPTGTDWMAHKMVDILRGGVQRDGDLLAAAAPEHPAPIPG